MSSHSSSPTPFSRFSRIGLFKSHSPSPSQRARSGKSGEDSDSWYIPYNGPFEAPRPSYVQPKDRDSWGDSVYGGNGGGGDEKLTARTYASSSAGAWDGPEADGTTGRQRSKTLSSTTSGVMDFRREGVRQRAPLPAYINIDPSGGVGDTPAPRPWSEAVPPKRSGLAQIFGFGKTKPLRVAPKPQRSPAKSEQEAYSYGTLASSPHSPLRHGFNPDDMPSRAATTSPLVVHPYAYPFPAATEEDLSHSAPHTAPIVSTNSNDSDPFRSAPMRPSQSTGTTRHRLKNSLSTPDLHKRTKPLSIAKGRDRWLSPETWCDALFLPRPRFKMRQDGTINYGKRVVSPPGSPVVTSIQRGDAVSRVLAHSHSMVELQHPQPPPPDPGPSNYLKPPRPKSFALDDLALPSPVPSLSKVLEEGQILDHQRLKWQTQAKKSFQNSRSRSYSRARTKSLPKDKKHPNVDFLLARSLAGNQDQIPVPRRSPTSSHTHTNSLSKTISTNKTILTNTSHSRTHSKNDSWSKSAKRFANGVLCVGEGLSPANEKQGFEEALESDGTRVIRFRDPSMSPLDPALLARNSPSQLSNLSDSRIGLALSTPPMLQSNRDSIHLPSHPYAQGGSYSYGTSARREQETAGERYEHHMASPHPYAMFGNRDSGHSNGLPEVRVEEAPNEDSMWTQYDDGQLREVYPRELQYSPYMMSTPAGRESAHIYDMVGVAEALANAMRTRDSGMDMGGEHPYSAGGSREPAPPPPPPPQHRQPVEYDATQPLYRRKFEAMHEPLVAPEMRLGVSRANSSTSSQALTPDTTSSAESTRGPLGSVDDLDNYRDLFYQPGPSALKRTASQRSQLTTLARQLEQEYEELSQGRESEILDATSLRERNSSFSSGRDALPSSRGDSAIQFVFSDNASVVGQRVVSRRGSILPFHPSISIPEDVESASIVEQSPTEESAEFTVGEVGYIPTPEATSSSHRHSFAGQFVSAGRENVARLGEIAGEEEDDTITMPMQMEHRGSLQPPHNPSRTSYATNSSVYSRMSGLSDFPVPPSTDRTPAHMQVLSSYFDGLDGDRDSHRAVSTMRDSVRPASEAPSRPSVSSNRLTFGGDAEIQELLDHLNHGR